MATEVLTKMRAFDWPRLGQFSVDTAALRNELLKAAPLAVAFRDGVLTINVPEDPLPAPFSWGWAEVWFGDCAVEIWFHTHAAQALLALVGSQQDLFDLTPEIRGMVLEYLLEPAIASLETAKDLSILLLDIELDVGPPPADALLLTLTSDRIAASSLALSGNLSRLAEWLNANNTSDQRMQTRARLAASYRAPPLVVSDLDLSNITPGSGFLMPPNWHPENITQVVLGGQIVVDVEATTFFEAQSLELTILGCSRHHGTQVRKGEKTMMEPKDIEVELSLEVARERFPFADVSDLTEGSILPFRSKIGTSVRLFCDGDLIADGTLVEIEGRYGVQITKLT